MLCGARAKRSGKEEDTRTLSISLNTGVNSVDDIEVREIASTRMLSSMTEDDASALRVLTMAYGSSLEPLTFAGWIGMEDLRSIGIADAV